MIRRLLLTITLLGLCLLAVPQTANATNLYGGVDCSKAPTSAICQPQPSNPIYGKNGLLEKITNIIAYVAGAAAIIVLLVGSIKLITSGSDTSKGGRVDEDVENARRAVIGAIIGLVIIVLGKLLITYLIDQIG